VERGSLAVRNGRMVNSKRPWSLRRWLCQGTHSRPRSVRKCFLEAAATDVYPCVGQLTRSRIGMGGEGDCVIVDTPVISMVQYRATFIGVSHHKSLMSLDASKMASLPSYQSRFCSGSFLALEFTLIPSICHLILEAHQFTLIKVCSNAQALTIRQQPAHQRAYGLFLISAYILHTHLLRNMVVVPGCRDTFYPRFGRGTRHEALELKGTANTSSSPTPSRSRHLGCVGPPRIGHLPVASRNSLIR
jgi:hypothetical protein